MTSWLTIKNWSSFQHYKDRNPPWIKLHRALLDDYAFAALPDAQKGQLRQQGLDTREDRRDERLQMRLDQMDRSLDRRLAAQADRGGLTQAQQRGNFEIDAAREMIAGLSDEDIRQRTTPTTASGRTNDLFDPAVARAAKLAARRKLGDDQWFDQRQGRLPSAADSLAGKPLAEMTDDQLQRFGRVAGSDGRSKIDAEVARRSLAGMPGMQDHRLGAFVDGKGYQVFDSHGQLVSYLRKRP